ncbi:MAG TPA: hypothetical protein VK903_07210 [Propionicimonas sp.]|nr:hypothetical protein [Propionicimonas sp.]
MTEREFVVKPLPAIRLAARCATAATQPEAGPLVGPLQESWVTELQQPVVRRS